MSGFWNAVTELATNESTYRNAVIAAVVLWIAASGELIAEKAGTINISLEGMMLAGGFAGAVGQHLTHSVWLALIFAMLAGFIVAWIQANMSHRLPADQFVVGLVLNVLVLGVVGYLTSAIEPKSHVVKRFAVPLIADIPLLGPALFKQPWVMYLAYPLLPLVWWVLYRTRWGLEVRAIGDDPNAADVSGLNVNRIRRQTIYLTGLLAGLAGGYFLFARVGKIEDSLIGGRGYIAIAAVIFGGWTLKGTVAGCLVFGLVASFALTIPGLGFKSIDQSFLAMAPNVVTIVAMAFFATRVRQPAALARPFMRGLK
jgi:general nucleoside transport system permease protein